MLESCLNGFSKDLIDREHLLANLTLAKVKPVNLAVSSSLGYLPKLKYSSLCTFSIFWTIHSALTLKRIKLELKMICLYILQLHHMENVSLFEYVLFLFPKFQQNSSQARTDGGSRLHGQVMEWCDTMSNTVGKSNFVGLTLQFILFGCYFIEPWKSQFIFPDSAKYRLAVTQKERLWFFSRLYHKKLNTHNRYLLTIWIF